jgi:hypothetical protein
MAPRVTVVDVHDDEIGDDAVMVEGVDLCTAADTVVGDVNEAVFVVVCDVLWDDGEIADASLQIGIRSVRGVRVENDEGIRASLIGNGRDVDAIGGELLAEDGTRGQACEVQH